MKNLISVYSSFNKIMPNWVKGITTYFLYKFKAKPTVNKKTASIYEKGIVVFSADFEMAWAFRASKTVKNATERGLRERKNVPEIVALLEKYEIPITWATVGHLFLDSCQTKDGVAHSDMIRPPYFENRNWIFSNGDWFDCDPCSNYKEAPAWYAPDLIDMIIKSKVKHEIGCHSFSHIDLTYEHCSTELAEAELIKCIEIAKNRNITLKSLVFPGGTYGNYETLKKLGFTNYRKRTGYDIDIPKYDKDGLVVIPTTYGLDITDYKWSANTMIMMGKSYVDKCIKHKKIAHLWFHPSMDPWYLKNVFPEILKYVDEKHKNGELKIMTMGQVAESFNSHNNKN